MYINFHVLLSLSEDEINKNLELHFNIFLKQLNEEEKQIFKFYCLFISRNKDKITNEEHKPTDFLTIIKSILNKKLQETKSQKTAEKFNKINQWFYQGYTKYYENTGIAHIFFYLASKSHINNNFKTSILNFFEKYIPTIKTNPQSQIILKFLLIKLIKYKKSLERRELNLNQLKQILQNNIDQEIEQIISSSRSMAETREERTKNIQLNYDFLINKIITLYQDYLEINN